MQRSDFPHAMFRTVPDLKSIIRGIGVGTVTSGISPHLFWEYDMEKMDWDAMRAIVVQRVIERGSLDDMSFIISKYGFGAVRDTVRDDIKCFSSDIDADFACYLFDLVSNGITHHRHKLDRERLHMEWLCC